MGALLKKPSAWIPILMSGAALLLVIGYSAVFGVTNAKAADEGAPARIFQLLLTLQIPIVVYFAISWLAQKPKHAFLILFIQFTSALVPLALIYFLEM